MIVQGIRTSIAKIPYILWFFRKSGPPVSPPLDPPMCLFAFQLPYNDLTQDMKKVSEYDQEIPQSHAAAQSAQLIRQLPKTTSSRSFYQFSFLQIRQLQPWQPVLIHSNWEQHADQKRGQCSGHPTPPQKKSQMAVDFLKKYWYEPPPHPSGSN